MRVARLIFTCCVLLASTAAFAQFTCSNDIQYGFRTCSSGGCSDVYPITTVFGCKPTGGCFQVQTLSTDCCGRTVYYSDFTGQACPFLGALKDPGRRTELLALAATANVLVRDCKGSFMPLRTLLDIKERTAMLRP